MGHLRQTLHKIDFTATGKKRKAIVDWFEANSGVLNPVLEEKRTAVMKENAGPHKQHSKIYIRLKAKAYEMQTLRQSLLSGVKQLDRSVEHYLELFS